MLERRRHEMLFSIGVITAMSLGLYFSSLHSYLLFHSAIEIITIAIAFTLFLLAWNTRNYLANSYLQLLGISYAFIALIDLLHALSYKGMNVFPGYGANLPTQLWIAARYLQAVTLLAAPLFMERKVENRLVFGGYAAVASVLVVMVFSGNFPDCFIEGKGLTLFKISSEYVITAFLITSLYLLSRKRKHVSDRVFILVVFSVVCTILSEISFTAYVSVYGFANMVGHIAKLAAFYLMCRAILVAGLSEPFELILRDLKQAEEALRRSQGTLEEKVRERTAALSVSEERYRSLIRRVQAAIVLHDSKGRILDSNPLAQELLGLSADQLLGKALIDPEWRFLREDGSVMPVAEYPVSLVLSSRQSLKEYVAGISRPDRQQVTWALINAELEYGDVGEIVRIIVSFVDITERRQAEKALQRLNRQLRAISNCNQTLMKAEDEQALLNDICHIVCDEAGYRMAWVGFAEQDEARSVRPVAWAGVEDHYLADANMTWADTEGGRSPAGRAIRNGESVCVQDYATDAAAAPWRESALQRGYRSSVALPLKDDSGCAFGALMIYSTEPQAFTPDEFRLLGELAGHLAYGITVLRAHVKRQQADEKLRDSEEKFSVAFQASPNMLAITRADGTILDVNEGYSRMLGYTRDESIGMTTSELSIWADPADRVTFIAGLKEFGHITDFETTLRRKDGTLITVLDSASTIILQGEACILSIAYDITGRKRMEDALFFVAQRGWMAGGENYFNALAQFLGKSLEVDYVVIDKLDENPDIAETVALFARGTIAPNMRYALKGTPCENVMGRQLCVYPQGVQQLFPEDTMLAEMGVVSYVGIPLWDSSGRPIGLIALMGSTPLPEVASATQVLQLVATRAAAELERERGDRKLRAREHEFRTLAESMPDNIIRYDREGRAVYVNPALEKLLGIAAADRIGKRVREFHADGSYEAYAQAVDAVLTRGENVEFEFILPGASKEPPVSQMRMIAERDEHGEVAGVLAIGRDITERKRAEEALRKLNVELEQRVRERTTELEQRNDELKRMNKLFVGRELTMVELKERIKKLEGNED